MKYQTLRQTRPGDAWTFAAHGARYSSKASAEETAMLICSNGDRVRLIPCGRATRLS